MGLPGLNLSTYQGIKCLVQGHSAVPPVRFEPSTPQSRVKHSTTEPLSSKGVNFTKRNNYDNREKLMTYKVVQLITLLPFLKTATQK